MANNQTKPRLLLHICCAPDATIPWPALLKDYDVTGFFYGSNIHPLEEYERRVDSVKILQNSMSGFVVFPPYEPEVWHKATYGLENEPEGGARCAICFREQFEATAKYAREYNFEYITTTLTISPHKNVKLINEIGNNVATQYGLKWLDFIWRKNNGFLASIKRSKELGLFRQNYCGCVWSKRS